MPRLIWVSQGARAILLVLSWGGSFVIYWEKKVCEPPESCKLGKKSFNEQQSNKAFYSPPHKKWRVLCYSLWKFWNFRCPSIRFRPSISASFPDSDLSSFWPIFFKLCMDIDIRELLFGISNGLNLYINNRVTALDWCKNVVSRLLTWVVFDQFSSNFAWTLISGKRGLGLEMG